MTIAGATYREGVAYSADGAMYVAVTGTIPAGSFPLLAPDGSASAPSYSFSSRPTDGFFVGSGFVQFARGGASTVLLGTGIGLGSTGIISWSPTTDPAAGSDTFIGRAAANSIQFSAGSAIAGATARTELNKAVASIADAVATAAFTITIPNAAHSASIQVRVTGSLGAGGAIGANEATASNSYVISLTRTAGVNATAAISSAFGAAATAVAGAATVTCTAALSVVSGAVGATNTFTVNVTITRSGGSSTNHTCLVYAVLMNANATGITIA